MIQVIESMELRTNTLAVRLGPGLRDTSLDLLPTRQLDELFTDWPFLGSRQMAARLWAGLVRAVPPRARVAAR